MSVGSRKRNTSLRHTSNIFASSDTHSVCIVKNSKGSWWVEFPDYLDVDFETIGDTEYPSELECKNIDNTVYNTLDNAFIALTKMYSNPIGFYQNTPSFLIGYCLASGVDLQSQGILI